MTAYVIADVEVSDPARYAQYTALSPAAIAAAGGAFIVRGGNPATLEGDWAPTPIVVARFATVEAAKAFYDSALYREARAKREGATTRFNMIVAEGYEG
ncbi:MAG: DUF1330 domain-containing protein [Lautropia sp.]